MMEVGCRDAHSWPGALEWWAVVLMVSKRPQRIVMILENCSYLHDARAGKEAQALRQAEYIVSVISPEKGLGRTVVDGVVIFGFPQLCIAGGTVSYILEYAYSTIAILLMIMYVGVRDGFDVLHFANPPDCLIPAAAVVRLWHKRIVYDQHDLCPELYQVKVVRPRRTLVRLLLYLERLSHRWAHHSIVMNESCWHVAQNRAGCPADKVTVVRNGPDLGYTDVLPRNCPSHSQAKIIIVFAGVAGSQDGLDHLCYALNSLLEDRNCVDFCCLIIGDGDALGDIRKLSKRLQLGDVVKFEGWVSDPVKYFGYLLSADICVSPEPSNCYNDRSTFVKVTDYMLAGKPIVAFDLPETRVTAGSAALYAIPNDSKDFAHKIMQLIDDPSLRLSMGRDARSRIENGLAWQHSIPALLGVYSKLG